MADPDPREVALAGMMLRPKPDLSTREQGDDQQLDRAPLSAPDTLTDVTASMHDIVGNSLVNAALTGAADTGMEHSIAATMGGAVAGLGGWAESGFSSNTMMRQALHRHGAGPAPSAPKLNKGGGRPLPDDVRVRMEAAMGRDFSHVRIHTDGAAQARSRDIHAHAFTVGSDIYFGSGEFQPGTEQGDRLLGHELTHVIQHDEGRLRLPDRDRSVSLPTDPTEVEAYANEKRVLSELQRVDLALAEGTASMEPTALMDAERIGEVVGDVAGGGAAGGDVALDTGAEPEAAQAPSSTSRAEAAQASGGRPISDEEFIGEVLEEKPRLDDAQKAIAQGSKVAAVAEVAGEGAAAEGKEGAGAEGAAAAQAPTEDTGAPAEGSAPATGGQAPAVATGGSMGVTTSKLFGEPMGIIGSESGPTMPSVDMGPPAVAGSPASQALLRVSAVVTAQASTFEQGIADSAARVVGSVQSSAASIASSVLSAGTDGQSQISSMLTAERSRIEAQTASAVSAIGAVLMQQVEAIKAHALSMRTQIQTEISQRRDSATASVETARSSIMAAGDAQANRAVAESAALAEQAQGLASISGSGDDPQAEAQQRASTEIAEKAADTCKESGREMADHVREDAKGAADKVVAHLQPFLSMLDGVQQQATTRVDGVEQGSVSNLESAGGQATSMAEDLGSQALTSLLGREQQMVSSLAEMVTGGAEQIQSAGVQLQGQIDGEVALVQARFQQQMEQLQTTIAGAGVPDLDSLAEAESAMIAYLQEEYDKCMGALEEMGTNAIAGLQQVGASYATEIGGAVMSAQTEATQVGDQVCGRLDEHTGSITDQIGTAGGTACTEMSTGVESFSAELGTAQQEFATQVQQGQTDAVVGLQQYIDDGLVRQGEQVGAAQGKITEAHSEIGSEYSRLRSEAESKDEDESCSQIHRSIWSAIGDFFNDLGESIMNWFRQAFGDVVGGIIGSVVGFFVNVVQFVVMANFWVFAQVVNLVWGFVWGETVFDVPGAGVFAFIGDVIAGILIWGDLRDIWKHLIWKLITGQEITGTDWLIVGLSAIGIVLSFTVIGGVFMAIFKGGTKATVKSVVKSLAKEIGEEAAEKLVREMGEEAAERLARRLSPDVLQVLSKELTGAEIKALVDRFGKSAIEALTPALKGKGLREVSKLDFFKFAPAMQEMLDAGKGAACRGLSALRGKTIAEVQSELTESGFTKATVHNGMEIWTHADHSIVRLKFGAPAIPDAVGRMESVIREVSKIAGNFSKKKVFAKITEDGAAIPAGTNFARDQLQQWFKKYTKRVATSSESDALMDIWGRSGHIDILP